MTLSFLQPFQWNKLLHSGPATAQLYSWPFTFSAPGDSWAVALVTGVQVSLFLGLCPRFGNVHRLGIFREGIFLPLSCVIGGLAEDTGGWWPIALALCLPASGLGQLKNPKLSCFFIKCLSRCFLSLWTLVETSHWPHPALSKRGFDVVFFFFNLLCWTVTGLCHVFHSWQTFSNDISGDFFHFGVSPLSHIGLPGLIFSFSCLPFFFLSSHSTSFLPSLSTFPFWLSGF